MSILILGANGYLGSKIVHILAKRNLPLVCTKREKSNLSRLDDLLSDGRIQMIPASSEAVEAALQYDEFEWVLNIACNYGRSNVLYDSVIEANIVFPLEVLNKAVQKGVKKFLTIGTGLPGDLNMYSFSKKVFSEFGSFYAEKHHIGFYNMKLEMFYGSDEPKDRFIPSLILDMLSGKEVNVTLGTQHRDFVAVEDVVTAILQVMDFMQGGGQGGYQDIPVGTGIAPAMSEVVSFIWNETGRKSKINWGAAAMRDKEPDCFADTDILSSMGEWSPVFWKDGLRRMIRDLNRQNREKNI